MGESVGSAVRRQVDRLDFQTYPPPAEAMSEIHDAHPAPGEQAVYGAHTENGMEVSYLSVAEQPNLPGRGRVVLIGGILGASQEAGFNLLTEPARLDEVLGRFGVHGGRRADRGSRAASAPVKLPVKLRLPSLGWVLL